MTREQAIEQLKHDRDLCNFNPMTGEEEPMNEDCRKSAEALDMAIKALEQETIKGHWIEKGKADIAYDMCGYKSWATKYMCNHCGFIHIAIENHGVYNYCPNCGAKMESEEKK